MLATMEKASLERRTDDRTDCLVGLWRWLEAARQTSGASALALADQSGFLIAGAGPARYCEELAAVAPLPPLQSDGGEVRRSALPGGLWLCEIPSCHAEATWQKLGHGCSRILRVRD